MSRHDGQPAYVIPAHNLRAMRPAPISFEAARAEALGGVRVHGPESESVTDMTASLAPVLAQKHSTPMGEA